MDEGRSYLGVAVGRHRDTDPGAADQHAALGLARGHGIGHGCPEVRIVDRLGGVGAEVQHLETRLLQVALENLLKVEAGMIRRDRDGAPRHVDDRSPLAVEPPDTISGAAVSPSPKIVESGLQDVESAQESAGPDITSSCPSANRTVRLVVLSTAEDIDLRDGALSRHRLQACLLEKPTR